MNGFSHGSAQDFIWIMVQWSGNSSRETREQGEIERFSFFGGKWSLFAQPFAHTHIFVLRDLLQLKHEPSVIPETFFVVFCTSWSTKFGSKDRPTHPVQAAQVLHHVLICIWVIVDDSMLFIHTARLKQMWKKKSAWCADNLITWHEICDHSFRF